MKKSPKKIVVAHQAGFTFLKEKKIICLKAKRNYTEIHIKGPRKLLVARTLGDFESLLAKSACFFRPHRSYIINLNYLQEWIRKDGGYLLMANDLQIPLARNRKESLLQLIERFK